MADGRVRRAWSAAGVRLRTTVVSVGVVGVVLLVGLVALADLTERRLEDQIRSSTETRALDVAALAEAGALGPDIVTLSANQLIQVVVNGEVVAASPGLGGIAPLAVVEIAPGSTRPIAVTESVFVAIEKQSQFIEDESPYVVLGRGFQSDDGPGVVLVASSVAPAEAAVSALRPLLFVGFPLTLLVVGVTVWFLTGWALRPVEGMRREAAAISETALSRRLPVPASQDEIRRLADTLNEMLDRLESAAIRQRRFVSDASHELKTPLATIRTMLEVAGSDPGFEDWPGLLAALKGESARMEGLIGDLLTLARMEEGRPGLPQGDVDLDHILGAVAERVGRTFPGVVVDFSGIEAARVVGDSGGLDRLMWNLAANAARYGAGRVTIACRMTPGAAVVTVADDGPGIVPADRERIFERFVRLDESRARNQGGSGLGLAVARAVARSHGGDVRVVDSQAGATFEVRLPA